MPSNPGIKVLLRDSPARSIALSSNTHALVLKSVASNGNGSNYSSTNTSSASLPVLGWPASTPQCIAEFGPVADFELETWRQLSFREVHGTLGLITFEAELFLCVVDSATKIAEVRPGETVLRINSVEFHCLTSSKYDALLSDIINPWPTDDIDEGGHDQANIRSENPQQEHPCLAIKKLLSSGTFFFSADFDLTRRLQKRASDQEPTIALDSLDAGFLWNSYMVQPLVDFRARLTPKEKKALDASRILTSAIRGFCITMTIPFTSAPFHRGTAGMPAKLTIISRLSCRRAGTRFNSRGMDDEGNVANFVESETVLWSPVGICFSYTQIRGSVPLFWEQASGLLPNQQKITVTRSPEATQPAFDKHFEQLERSYGAVHVVNLLSREKSQEVQLSTRYRRHIVASPLNEKFKGGESEHQLLQLTEYDFHAETAGTGYSAAMGIRHRITDSINGFAFFLSEEKQVVDKFGHVTYKVSPILQQEGVFRTNCLDCLDRTNLIQGVLSELSLKAFFHQQGEEVMPDFWSRHSALWADNGDTLSKIYAGTGALKSSFTRHGKMSLGGMLADARKSATRAYINNFADKDRQNTIDMLLGRLITQQKVHLYDPINEWVQAELQRRSAEFMSVKDINILVGTFNLNGRERGLKEDLSSWLCPSVDPSQRNPEIVAVGFQEIVELSPQQIMSTDPRRRQNWEDAVKACLNENAARHQEEEYVLVRGGQLVGASLSIFVRASVLPFIKNVEGSIKKTGLSGMAGNKGAVAIRMEYASTSLCFVTAHLAAGFANYDERNRDYRTISAGLRFQRNRTIDDHDNVIWLGDFNYRIGLSNERARSLTSMGDLPTLYENDQLNIQMTHGNVFKYYEEAKITFNPTYKFDNNSDEYDSSEKARVPAWTDRVLRKGENLKQINYNIAHLRFSDHRPVYATFVCRINVIDEQIKDTLTTSLFTKRRQTTRSTPTPPPPRRTREEAANGLQHSIDTAYPSWSTAQKKWWLDNGVPAHATTHAPNEGWIPNGKRLPNPYAPSDELDWVQIERDKVPAPPPPRRSIAARNGSGTSYSNGLNGAVNTGSTRAATTPAAVKRKVLPPPQGHPSPTTAPATRSISRVLPPPSRTPSMRSPDMPPASRTNSQNSSHSHKASGPPPRPKKPAELSSPTLASVARFPARKLSLSESVILPPKPPVKKASLTGTPANSSAARHPAPSASTRYTTPSSSRHPTPSTSSRYPNPPTDAAPPLLPASRKMNTGGSGVWVEKQDSGVNLMDEREGEEGLHGFVVLQPSS